MYTMYTFLEKVCMMKVREGKKIKKFCGTNFFSFLESHPQQPIPRGYAGMQVCMVVERGKISTFFTPFSRHEFFAHISAKSCISRHPLSPR